MLFFVVAILSTLVAVPEKDITTQLDTRAEYFIPCNETRAAEFYRSFPEQDALRNQEDSAEFRRIVKHILEKAGVALDAIKASSGAFLNSGTINALCMQMITQPCLGVRNPLTRQCFAKCHFGCRVEHALAIPYMIDVDIGVWMSDYKPSIIAAMESVGFQLKMQLGLLNDSYELSFLYKNTKLDIFFFYRTDDFVWNGGTKPETGEKYKYVFPHFTLCWTTFLDLLVRVPCETAAYVEANYGTGWFFPTSEWAWNVSPPNVLRLEPWPDGLLQDVISVFQTSCDNHPDEAVC